LKNIFISKFVKFSLYWLIPRGRLEVTAMQQTVEESTKQRVGMLMNWRRSQLELN